MLILRSINLNEGAQPEDMVSIRAWFDKSRVITIRHRRVNALKTMQAQLIEGWGGCDPGDLLVSLVNQTLDGVVLVVDGLEDAVAENEDAAVQAGSVEIRHRLANLRRQAITLRRYIWPERDVVSGLRNERVSWLTDMDRTRLREAADRLSRIIEELDAARDRAAVTAEEVASRLAEMINQRLYTLSIVAAVFLPLGFVTGVMGVNVGGIPGQQWRWGFLTLCGSMAVLGVVQLWLFRKLRWL
jgi:zinc transporter